MDEKQADELIYQVQHQVTQFLVATEDRDVLAAVVALRELFNRPSVNLVLARHLQRNNATRRMMERFECVVRMVRDNGMVLDYDPLFESLPPPALPAPTLWERLLADDDSV